METNSAKCKENQHALNLTLEVNNRWLFTDASTNILIFENNFDLDSERLLIKNYNWEFLFLANDFLYLYNKSTLKSLSLLTGLYEWEVDLGVYCEFLHDGEIKQGGINHIVGVYAQTLWLICSQRRLMGIDVANGKIIANILLTDLHEGLYANEPHLNQTTGELAFFEYTYYFVINLNTLQLQELYPILLPNKAFVETKTFADDYVYFTAQLRLENGGYTVIGVFNRQTHEIDWSQDLFLNECFVNQPPQISDNKLYVLDTGGTLHIFEREELV